MALACDYLEFQSAISQQSDVILPDENDLLTNIDDLYVSPQGDLGLRVTDSATIEY